LRQRRGCGYSSQRSQLRTAGTIANGGIWRDDWDTRLLVR
jgi:hypothetical protein